MEALTISPTRTLPTALFRTRSSLSVPAPDLPFPSNFTHSKKRPKPRLFTAISPTVTTQTDDDPFDQQSETDEKAENFDWFSEWYPIMPECDLDKRVPHGKRVMGLDVVVWWDRNEGAWKVFDDSCPHRLAPLSDGRIDQWGRLQCVYHGWCFGGHGDCKFIPQAPPDGPPVHTFPKACVAVYPSTLQNGFVWFWPSTDSRYKDILTKKKPPYIPELDDPSYTCSMINRDIPYGYEVLIENLMDPAHVPYAHYGIMNIPRPKGSVKADREGGRPMDIVVQQLDKGGFAAKQGINNFQFIPPCLFYGGGTVGGSTASNSSSTGNAEVQTSSSQQRRLLLVFLCIPVSPGHSRVIFTSPRNFGVLLDRVIPRWIFHISQNLILDSDLYLLHIEERRILDVGVSNWQKACFVPTKADANVVAFRKWLKKYSGGQIDWGHKFGGALPPTPPREQLMDRYWSHVVNCSSCSGAYKGLKVTEVSLQVFSIATIALLAATKQGMISALARNTLVVMAVLSFAASKWLSHFIYKNFHFHDYNHALR